MTIFDKHTRFEKHNIDITEKSQAEAEMLKAEYIEIDIYIISVLHTGLLVFPLIIPPVYLKLRATAGLSSTRYDH